MHAATSRLPFAAGSRLTAARAARSRHNPTDKEVESASLPPRARTVCGTFAESAMRIVVANFSQMILFSAIGIAMTYALLSVK
jgi:hypothetical protein